MTALIVKNCEAIITSAHAPVLRGQDILCDGGAITDIGPDLAAPAGAQIIDGRGLFLYPGLINTHHHFFQCFVLCGWLPFCKSFLCVGRFVRSSLVFGLLARRTWPLALMVSTNQVPFRNSNSKRSGQSKGRLGFRADKVPSPHWSCKLLFTSVF